MQEAAMATKDFIVFDSDSHVVEPPALWEKYSIPSTARSVNTRCGGKRGAPQPI
jgi:hypothetical protein